MSRPSWDFDYAPVHVPGQDDEVAEHDWILATSGPVDAETLAGVVSGLLPGARIEKLVQRAPIYWTRIRSPEPATRRWLGACLVRAGVAVRYVASPATPDLSVPAPIDVGGAPAARAKDWKVRRRTHDADPQTPERWFLRGPAGVNVDRARFSRGAGTRLAVIDNDAGEAESLGLDAEVLVNVLRASRASLHASTMIGWAVGSRGGGAGPERRFMGVAPDASPRLYCIPKPGADVLSVPLAIVRAVDDGADVVVCGTYVEGTASPLLDDALEFAVRLGRRGRGTAVILPTGREASSAAPSVHASFALSLADPASDPRATCIGPGGRDGAWFLWPDRKGKYRPFANRGPAVRWLAPGDDMAFPFGDGERLCHAESSGAAAVAAGVMLLVIAANPLLSLGEIDLVIGRSVDRAAPSKVLPADLADRSDVLPSGRDRDGHDAKHGYGRMNAARACLLASDPVAASLVSMGEDHAAAAYLDLRKGDLAPLYSKQFASWAARALLADGRAMHAAKVIVRHARLVADDADRFRAHGDGALLRQVALALRGLVDSDAAPPATRSVSIEAARLFERLSDLSTSRVGRAAWDAGARHIFAAVARRAAEENSAPGATADAPIHLGARQVRA